jgi:hypothetical protein
VCVRFSEEINQVVCHWKYPTLARENLKTQFEYIKKIAEIQSVLEELEGLQGATNFSADITFFGIVYDALVPFQEIYPKKKQMDNGRDRRMIF